MVVLVNGSLVDGYQHFWKACCPHICFGAVDASGSFSEMKVRSHQIRRYHNPCHSHETFVTTKTYDFIWHLMKDLVGTVGSYRTG